MNWFVRFTLVSQGALLALAMQAALDRSYGAAASMTALAGYCWYTRYCEESP